MKPRHMGIENRSHLNRNTRKKAEDEVYQLKLIYGTINNNLYFPKETIASLNLAANKIEEHLATLGIPKQRLNEIRSEAY